MAQTTDAMTFEDCKVEISPNGSTWYDASGFANSVAISGGERQTGETYTFDGEFAIVRRGKSEPLEVQLNVVYTEVTSDPADRMLTAYENGTDFYVRWSPGGGNIGDYMYTTEVGIITSPPYPGGEAGGGDPVVVSLNLKVGKINRTTIT